MHDTETLRKAARSDPRIARHFWDVYGADQVPKKEMKALGGCCIVNTDPIDEPGQHWVALFYPPPNGGGCEFFDSYAEKPSDYRPRLWRSWNSCPTQMPYPVQQMMSDVCGDYCLYYLHRRCKSSSLRDIAHAFSPSNLLNNDFRVQERVHQLYGLNLKHAQVKTGSTTTTFDCPTDRPLYDSSQTAAGAKNKKRQRTAAASRQGCVSRCFNRCYENHQ